MLQLTPKLFKQLTEVNTRINRSVKYREDTDLYGQVDFWTVAVNEGDCEDYALAKRQALLELGWPIDSLSLAVVRDETGAGHAVLTVDTSEGTYVLDNRYLRVMAWQTLPYEWIMRQGPNNTWVTIT